MMVAVAGIDLGPSLDNESTGVQIARRSAHTGVWVVTRTRDHWIRGRDQLEPNPVLANAVADCSVVVIDAPLRLRSEKPWERTLISLADLSDSMKPSFTWAILSHAWRAFALREELGRGRLKPSVFEVFPASWFWLCEFDDKIGWKADDTARDRKVAWFKHRCSDLGEDGLQIKYGDQWATADDADALPCLLCGILIAEKRALMRLDETEPAVLFPPQELWDHPRLPEPVRNLNWQRFGEAANPIASSDI
jgi:predicted nuclease with RNAse H fold